MTSFIRKRARERGLAIEDAKEPLLLEVKAQDVDTGNKKDPGDCGFARACKRGLNVRNAYFFRSTAYLETRKKLVRYHLPTSMQKEIVSFDRNKTMEPGMYQLKPPAPSQSKDACKTRDTRRASVTKRAPVAPKIRRRIHKTQNVRGAWNSPTVTG